MSNAPRLSDKAILVLSLIAKGHSYGQIVDGHPEIRDTESPGSLTFENLAFVTRSVSQVRADPASTSLTLRVTIELAKSQCSGRFGMISAVSGGRHRKKRSEFAQTSKL